MFSWMIFTSGNLKLPRHSGNGSWTRIPTKGILKDVEFARLKEFHVSCVEEAGSTIIQTCGSQNIKAETRLSDMVMSDSGYAVLQSMNEIS